MKISIYFSIYLLPKCGNPVFRGKPDGMAFLPKTARWGLRKNAPIWNGMERRGTPRPMVLVDL